tara:strand:+ start:1552 stop:1836 length:285 start_codon:yes stop_codon:yes gene_type:complete
MCEPQEDDMTRVQSDDPLDFQMIAMAAEMTADISYSNDRLRQVAKDRRALFADLKNRGYTYPQLAAATGLHKMTIQQEVRKYRREQSLKQEFSA